MECVFEHLRGSGQILKEVFSDGRFEMQYTAKDGTRVLSMYDLSDLAAEKKRDLYGGESLERVLSSGRDILREHLEQEGEPSYERVEMLLPPIEEGAYAFFGGAASWSGIELELARGVLFSQVSENNNQPKDTLFDPASEDEILGKKKPFVCLLNRRFPILLSVHTDGEHVLELLYFVEAGDPDRDPVVWTRIKRYALSAPERFTLSHQVISRSRVIFRHEIAADTFYTALGDTVAYWHRFEREGADFCLPERQMEDIIANTQIGCAVTFSGDHPHYGHRYYGKEMHDHFPPNLLWSIEMCCVLGRVAWARRIFVHLFRYILTDEGRFVYRQGNDELFGASACEYAQLLWLTERYAELLQVDAEYLDQLTGMGQYLISHLRPCLALDGHLLIYMCAEADSNTRVHAYINNNLWCVRGFYALARLIQRFSGDKEAGLVYRGYGERLYGAVLRVLEKECVSDERFGLLPPFRVGYTAAPATLSGCRDTFSPMSDEEYARYARRIDMREQGDAKQEYTENCYANYRYYPEMLGTMLLPASYADGVVALRENLGGEILGMTRFMGHLDDWPVLHYARFLLESGRVNKYLTLLYAHAAHHGRPDLGCYYEQVTPNGKVMAEDCVPSLLTVPVMAAWMVAYEDLAEKRLSLLSAIPLSWYEKGFSAHGVGLSFGKVSVDWHKNRLTLSFTVPPKEPFRLSLRHKRGLGACDISEGREYILSYDNDTLLLRGGVKEMTLTLG